MTRTLPLLCIALAACAALPDGPPPVDEPEDDLGGDLGGDPADGEFGFESVELGDGALAPVSGVLDGGLVHAWIDDGVVVVADADRSMTVSWNGSADAVALAVGPADRLHLAWSDGGEIHYLEVDPETLGDAACQEPPTVLDAGPARDPNLAVSEDGDVAVVWTEVLPPEEQGVRAADISLVWRRDGVFGPPRVVNEGCCESPEAGVATAMSGASLALGPGGEAHVVYEWQTWANTTIDYVHERGDGFSEPVVVSNVAYAPCPALAVDDAGAHITFLTDGNRDVWYIRVQDGVATPRVSLYASEHFIDMALMSRDGAGVMHVAASQRSEEGGKLTYLSTTGDAASDPIVLGSEPEPGRLVLTPRAGGALASPDGDVLFSWTRRPDWQDDDGAGEVGWGRAR